MPLAATHRSTRATTSTRLDRKRILGTWNNLAARQAAPLIKDKLFFFGGYEGQRYTVGNTGSLQTYNTVPLATVVSPADPGYCQYTQTGDCLNSIPDAIANVHAGFLQGFIPNDVSATSLKIAGCTFTPPNTVTCDGSGFPLNPSTDSG